ncbi:MAG: ABA4-like family protein [Alphaproteobacteria bacterium]
MIETAFTIANLSVLPFWALLIFLPNARITRHFAQDGLIIILLGAAYTGLFVWTLTSGDSLGAMSSPSLETLSASFTDPRIMLLGWIHYLAFDLFVGMWIARDAKRFQISHFLVAPCLFFTFMAGPLGAAAYLLIRFGYTRCMNFISQR